MAAHNILLLIIIIIIIVNVNKSLNYDTQCHNYYEDQKCELVTFQNITCELCTYKISYQTVTVCNTSEEHQIDTTYIFKHLPLNTTELVIKFDNVWRGYLPLKPQPIDLSGIGRLVNLQYFQISDGNRNFFQPYTLNLSVEAIRKLTNLTRLKIRISVDDRKTPTIADIVANLPKLNTLDLSYTRCIGKDSLINILNNLNHTAIKYLCLRKYQLVGGYQYTSNFDYVIGNVTHQVFPNLEELDLSDNMFARIPPGISSLAPKLKRYDISGNILVDTFNIALLLEVLMHPEIIELNIGYQGYRGYFHEHRTKTSQNHTDVVYIGKNFLNTKIKADDNDHYYLMQEIAFISDCIDNVTSGNISYLFTEDHGINICRLLKCILPSFFYELNCGETFLPAIKTIYDFDCMFFMDFPIGRNLKTLYFSHVHLEQSGLVGIALNGKFCVNVNNSLNTIEIDGNNVWMESAQIGKTIKYMNGIRGLDKVVSVSISNNSLTILNISIISPFPNIQLPSLTYLDLSGNIVSFNNDQFQLCKSAPKIEHLNLNNAGLQAISPIFLQNCSDIKTLLISYNSLPNYELNSLDFSTSPNLTNLDLRGNGINYLLQNLTNQLEMMNLTIDLGDNPLWCNCSQVAKNFTKWLKENKNMFRNFERYYCEGHNGFISIHDINAATFWNSCDQAYSLKIIIISIVSTLGATMLFALMLCVYKIRWRLRYYIFKIQQLCKMACSLSNGSNRNQHLWRYDAFISYCALDRFWVHDTLMQMLETKYGFHLCIHYRDFPAGGGIAETISERMNQSREIIIVLSETALKSEWCSFELDEALLQIHRRNMRLIIIKLGKLKTNLLNSKLAHILDSHTILEWSDDQRCHKLFWASLVGLLYDNPYGGCGCCCPYGASSLEYWDIINPQVTEYEEEIEQLPCQVKEPWILANKAKTDYKNAKRFQETLEEVLKEEELPQWAYGPIPTPIGQLLKKKKVPTATLR